MEVAALIIDAAASAIMFWAFLIAVYAFVKSSTGSVERAFHKTSASTLRSGCQTGLCTGTPDHFRSIPHGSEPHPGRFVVPCGPGRHSYRDQLLPESGNPGSSCGNPAISLPSHADVDNIRSPFNCLCAETLSQEKADPSILVIKFFQGVRFHLWIQRVASPQTVSTSAPRFSILWVRRVTKISRLGLINCEI